MYKNIIVIGYHEIACTEIEELINHGFNVKAVIPNPIRPGQYSGWYREVRDLAKYFDIPVWEEKELKNNLQLINRVKELSIDAIFSGFSSFIFPEPLINAVNLGCFNFHNSDLPKYRGRAAPIWALINGESEIAMTLHKITPKIDAGPIIDKELISLDQHDNIKSVYQKCNLAQLRILRRFLPQLQLGIFKESEQDDCKNGNTNSWNEPNDRFIDFNAPINEILNKIRALSYPFPNALTKFRDKYIEVIKADCSRIKLDLIIHNNNNGMILAIDDIGIIINTRQGPIRIIEVNYQGRHILGRHLFELLHMSIGDTIGN